MQTKVTKKNNNVTIQCRKKTLKKTKRYNSMQKEITTKNPTV